MIRPKVVQEIPTNKNADEICLSIKGHFHSQPVSLSARIITLILKAGRLTS